MEKKWKFTFWWNASIKMNHSNTFEWFLESHWGDVKRFRWTWEHWKFWLREKCRFISREKEIDANKNNSHIDNNSCVMTMLLEAKLIVIWSDGHDCGKVNRDSVASILYDENVNVQLLPDICCGYALCTLTKWSILKIRMRVVINLIVYAWTTLIILLFTERYAGRDRQYKASVFYHHFFFLRF